MKKFEKNLKIIQAQSDDCILSDKDLNLSPSDLTYLRAKGLITLNPLYDGELNVQLTDSGITYFDDKKEARKKIILSWSFDFSMAVLSAVCGSVLTLFIQHVLMK